jgi:two-component system, OmpR family, sensor kinase
VIGTLRTLSERVPLRVTLVGSVLLLMTAALGVSGSIGTIMLRGYLTDRVDNQLRGTAQVIIQVAQSEGASGVQRRAEIWVPVSTSIYFQVDDTAGVITNETLKARNASQHAPRLPTLDLASARTRHNQPFTARPLQGLGHNWRVLVTVLPDDSGTLVVAISLDDVDDTVAELSGTQALVGAAVLALLAIVGYLMVRTSLRRLAEVERTAREIAAGDLTRRVPPGHPDTEVGRLAAAFNRMLGEIETAFRAREASERAARNSEARMRRFIADASHELRTPLTAIRGFAELYRQGGGDADHAIARIEHHATRMGLLVEDLLLLARLDQQRPLDRFPVDLLALAADTVADTTATSPDHPVELRAMAPRPPVVLGDEARLRQVIGNLLSNAVVHTPAGTPVTVTVDVRDGAAVLEVADAGTGLATEDAARVFERFYRTDPARSRVRGGSGLGLPIVQALVAAHGGEVSLATAPGQGARFEVRLPLYEPVVAGAPGALGAEVWAAGATLQGALLSGGDEPATERPADS